MTRLVARAVYYFMYWIIYLSPIMVLMFAQRTFGFELDLAGSMEALGVFKYVIIILVVGYMFVLPGYRANLAADAYGDREMGFWEAHVVSGAILRTHLSFLPVIGGFFRKHDE